jgi:hypothetical protein
MAIGIAPAIGDQLAVGRPGRILFPPRRPRQPPEAGTVGADREQVSKAIGSPRTTDRDVSNARVDEHAGLRGGPGRGRPRNDGEKKAKEESAKDGGGYNRRDKSAKRRAGTAATD